MKMFGRPNIIATIILFSCSVFFAEAKDYPILDFGAKIDGKTNNTLAVQKAIDTCFKNGGGTIIFPAGTCLTGTIFLRSNISIYLSPGAIWKAVNAITAFPYLETVVMSRENKSQRRALIYASNAHNIKIYGEGTIDGGGDYGIFKVKEGSKDRYNFRPFGVYFVKCQNISLDGIHMQNSAFWMQRYQSCKNLRLTNLSIYNHSNYNNDGIDIDGCEDVFVSNCLVDSTDDALCLKSEGSDKCRNIVITNCILSSHATPLKLGTASIGGFENIAINNIVIRPSKSKKMIHELKSWKGLSGIDILCVDGGTIDGLNINNIVMDSIGTPIFIKLGNRNSKFPGIEIEGKGKIKNVQISQVIAKNTGSICSMISGYPNAYIENVTLKDIYVHVNEGLGLKLYDDMEVPENSDGYPYSYMHGKRLPATGFFIRHAKKIRIENFRLELADQDIRPAIWAEDVQDLIIRGLDTGKDREKTSIKQIDSSLKILE